MKTGEELGHGGDIESPIPESTKDKLEGILKENGGDIGRSGPFILKACAEIVDRIPDAQIKQGVTEIKRILRDVLFTKGQAVDRARGNFFEEFEWDLRSELAKLSKARKAVADGAATVRSQIDQQTSL